MKNQSSSSSSQAAVMLKAMKAGGSRSRGREEREEREVERVTNEWSLTVKTPKRVMKGILVIRQAKKALFARIMEGGPFLQINPLWESFHEISQRYSRCCSDSLYTYSACFRAI